MNKEITREDSLRLRAVAILCILLHNFLHWMPGGPSENEYGFNAENANRFIHLMIEQPANFLVWISSYYGHYGVIIFLFLSGYGLTRKYRGADFKFTNFPSWWQFQRARWRGLFPAIIASAIAFLLYAGIREGFTEIFRKHGLNLLFQGLGISPFLPGKNVFSPIGPWWFISLILQLYLLFPILVALVKRYGNVALLAVIGIGVSIEYFGAGAFAEWAGMQLKITAIGQLAVFSLGMWFALQKPKELSKWVICLALAIFLLGSLWSPLWVPANLGLTVVSIALSGKFTAFLQNYRFLDQSFVYLGKISIYLFLVCGFLRWPLVDHVLSAKDWWTPWWLSVVYVIFCIFVATLLDAIMKRLF